MSGPKKLLKWIGRLLERLPDDARVATIRGELAADPRGSAGGSELRIAVQCLQDPFYFGIFSAIARQLEKSGVSAELVVVSSINGGVGNGWRARLNRSTLMGMILYGKWVRAFAGTVNRVAYRSLSLAHPLGDLLDWFRSRRVWQREKSNPDISALRIRGLPVGDLIIDSYLRFRPAPRFDVADPFVAQLIWQVHRDIRRARAYFRNRKPRLYLTSYTTYIDHGVATRVALEQGVRVHSFGSLVQFGKRVTSEDWFHTPDAGAYRRTFEALDSQPRRLEAAEQQLRTRLSGGIDAATSYMRVSAYAGSTEPLPDVAGAVVIFLHDFYDSPHVYADLVFPDFWTWVCFTIDTLQQAGIKFVVKPHPNQIELSSEVLQTLRAKYPALAMLSARVTNTQLAAAGIRCGVTVYGTVAHELAYLGVPSIGCARHPHHSFEFCRTASSAEQYRLYLLDAGAMPVGLEEMRRQALAFYYMHNLYGDPETLALREKYVAFWKACHDPTTAAPALSARFNELRTSPAFHRSVQRLVSMQALPVFQPGMEQLS
jgi:hypothetical protein